MGRQGRLPLHHGIAQADLQANANAGGRSKAMMLEMEAGTECRLRERVREDQ